MTALLLTLVVLALILLRVPVAYAMLIPSLGYLAFLSPAPLSTSVQQMVSSVNGFVLLAVPLFIFLGNIANRTGLGDIIFDAAQNVIGRVRGGLGYVNVATSLGFSWMSGTALSDVAVLGSVQVPQMLKRGYPRRLVAGLTVASSLVTPVMPPSVPAIILGVTAGVSIGGLFAAAILPALLLVVCLCLWIFFATYKRDDLKVPPPPSRVTWKSIVIALPTMVTPVIVLGGILGGLMTPTEAAGVALLYLVIISIVFYRSLSWSVLLQSVTDSTKTIGSLMILIASAAVFAWMLTMEQVPQLLSEVTQNYIQNPLLFMLVVVAFLLVLGMVMEPGAAILIAVPVLAPIAASYDIPPLQFAVLCLFTILIGLFTPPVGLVLFVLEAVTTLKMSEIVRGVLPFIGLFIVLAIMIAAFPQITLWLPSIAIL